jgi:eukaryotic-like serine/threonine-protein kinase
VEQQIGEPRGDETARPATEVNPEETEWSLGQGDEIAPELSAIRVLGGGLRYEAYLAWSDRLHSLVVVKVVRPGLAHDDHTLEGLEAEVRTLERLNHPVLPRSFGADLEGERPHVILEHLEGPRLSSTVRKFGPLAPEQFVPLAIQLCAAIHYMAAEGVVHLDVKPSNVIMGAPPRLIDLSVAKTVEECRRLTSPVGTDAYMAPEQCLPEEHEVGPPADVWGMGVTLFRGVSGKRPFSTGDHDSRVPVERWPQLEEQPAELADHLSSEAIAEPIMACLRHDPAERPAPSAVASALEAVLSDLPKPKISKLKPRLR